MRRIRRLTTTIVLAVLTLAVGTMAAAQANPTGAQPKKTTLPTSQAAPAASQADQSAAQKASVTASIAVKPDTLDFEQQLVGSSSVVQTITITAGAVQIDKVNAKATGDFSIDAGACGSKLGPNDTCALTVKFEPKQPKKTTASITITSEPDTGSKTISLFGEGVRPILSWTEPGSERAALLVSVLPALLVSLLFLLGIILVRWNMVARPSRRLLQAHIDAVRAQTISLSLDDAAEPTRKQVLLLLDRVEAVFIKTKNASTAQDTGEPRKQRAYFADYFFWTRGEESAAWVGIHEAEELLTKILPIDAVRARMQTVQPQLRQINSPAANALADAIKDVLTPAPERQPVPSDDRQRALLSEALGIVYDNSDRRFNELMSWQNKAVWLVGCGLLFIVILAAASQQGVLLLAGAVGGLLSRLSRSLQRADVPTDYGASWTTLFLSPVVGAMAGWSGVLLVLLGVQLGVLGQMFNFKSDLSGTLMLGIAFLLGFSERAFNGILTQLEDKTLAQTQAMTAQAQELNITTDKTLTPPAKVGVAYSQAVAASGGTPPYKWAPSVGKLPDGLSLDPTGKITGTPSTAGTFAFTLQVTDSGSKNKTQEFTLTVGQ